MLPEYDVGKLESAVYDFNRATGVSITLYDPALRAMTHRGLNAARYCRLIASCKEGGRICGRSNRALIEECRRAKRPVRHICGAGLLDIAIPLLHREEIVGFLMIGQIRRSEEPPVIADTLPLDHGELEDCYRSLPIYNDGMIESIINIATMLTKYIVFENMVKAPAAQSAAVASYIDAHLTERLSVEELARATHISPSGLYKCMRHRFGCTPREYIRARRIERALPLLEDTALSIERVAETVGFTDAAYFSRCFKKIHGCSPLRYRKKR